MKTLLDIYNAYYDVANDGRANTVKDLVAYAENGMGASLLEHHAALLIRCHTNLKQANDRDGQWSHNYHELVESVLVAIETEA